jgi:hypothetical protein
VKVQIPLRGDDQDMLVYNKEKTVYGSITSQMSIYGDLQVCDSPIMSGFVCHGGRLHVYESVPDRDPIFHLTLDHHYNSLSTHFSTKNQKNHLRDTISSKSYTESYAKSYV